MTYAIKNKGVFKGVPYSRGQPPPTEGSGALA